MDLSKKVADPHNVKTNKDQRVVNEEEENKIVNSNEEDDLNVSEDYPFEKGMSRSAQQQDIKNDVKEEIEDEPDEKII